MGIAVGYSVRVDVGVWLEFKLVGELVRCAQMGRVYVELPVWLIAWQPLSGHRRVPGGVGSKHAAHLSIAPAEPPTGGSAVQGTTQPVLSPQSPWSAQGCFWVPTQVDGIAALRLLKEVHLL